VKTKKDMKTTEIIMETQEEIDTYMDLHGIVHMDEAIRRMRDEKYKEGLRRIDRHFSIVYALFGKNE